MKNRYYLLRHGESKANAADLIVSDPKIGCEDYGLTERGRAQVLESVKGTVLNKNTVIVTSDFLRTKETAEICREALRVPSVIVEPGLRERYFGRFDGSSANHYNEIWAHDEKDSIHTPHGAESPRHLVHRLKRTMERLESQNQGETILLVSHGDPLRFLQLIYTDRPLTDHLSIPHLKPAELRPLQIRS